MDGVIHINQLVKSNKCEVQGKVNPVLKKKIIIKVNNFLMNKN